MASKPPRYLMREFVVLRILRQLKIKRFFEFGYGGGDMLVALAELGYKGDAFDFSKSAMRAAQQALTSNNVESVILLDRFPESGRYELVCSFEVIGYFKELDTELKKLSQCVAPEGYLLVSFAREGAGYSPAATGNMRLLPLQEVLAAIEGCGLELEKVVNYGFPVANFLTPLHFLFHKFKNRKKFALAETQAESVEEETGIRPRSKFFSVLCSLFATTVLTPFLYLQLFFSHTSLGNGYIILAKKPR